MPTAIGPITPVVTPPAGADVTTAVAGAASSALVMKPLGQRKRQALQDLGLSARVQLMPLYNNVAKLRHFRGIDRPRKSSDRDVGLTHWSG